MKTEITITKSVIGCIKICLILLSLLCQANAEITETCLRNDVQCIEPTISEFEYKAHISSTIVPPPYLTSTSLEGLRSLVEAAIQPGAACSPEPPKATLNRGENAFPQCDNQGTGREFINYYDGYCYYKLGNTQTMGPIGHVIKITKYNSVNNCRSASETFHDVSKTRVIECPDGYIHMHKSRAQEDLSKGYDVCGKIIDPPKGNCDSVGNPCQVSNGAKLESAIDFSYSGLVFARNYNSRSLSNTGFGQGWHSPFSKRLSAIGPITNQTDFYLSTGYGNVIGLRRSSSGVWSVREALKSNIVKVIETGNSYLVHLKQGDIDEYDLNGRLIYARDSNGIKTTFIYDSDNRLIEIKDRYNQSINLSYDENSLLDTVTDPLGNIYRYEFDSQKNLTVVIFADSTPADNSDNPRKIYHYENPDFPNHMTGITDENGNRYSTYAYDADGKAIATEHSQTTNAVGQERFELNYQ